MFKLKKAKRIANKIQKKLAPVSSRMAVVGSISREHPKVKDIDLLVIPKKGFRERLNKKFNVISGKNKVFTIKHRNVPINIWLTDKDSFGAAKLHFSKGKDILRLKREAKDRGLKLTRHGLFLGKSKITGKREKDITALLTANPDYKRFSAEGQYPRETTNYFRFRQLDPEEFDRSSFRSVKTPYGYNIMGTHNKDKEFKVQSMMYKKAFKWDRPEYVKGRTFIAIPEKDINMASVRDIKRRAEKVVGKVNKGLWKDLINYQSNKGNIVGTVGRERGTGKPLVFISKERIKTNDDLNSIKRHIIRPGKDKELLKDINVIRGLSTRGLLAHEAFHAKNPTLGRSEILAHLYGGLRSNRNKKRDWISAFKQVNVLRKTRPEKFKKELRKGLGYSAAGAIGLAGLGYGGYKLYKYLKKKKMTKKAHFKKVALGAVGKTTLYTGLWGGLWGGTAGYLKGRKNKKNRLKNTLIGAGIGAGLGAGAGFGVSKGIKNSYQKIEAKKIHDIAKSLDYEHDGPSLYKADSLGSRLKDRLRIQKRELMTFNRKNKKINLISADHALKTLEKIMKKHKFE